MQASTAERTEIFTKLLKLIELAPQRQHQCQPQSQTVPVAAATHAPIASPPETIQAPSSMSASPAPEPAPEPVPEHVSEIAPPSSAPELPSLTQSTSQPDLTPASPPEPISAVARCITARHKARADAFARSQPRYTADEAGAKAFRNAMPPLLGADNIREFIACVAHGMLIGVIENKDATKLLYAAQVAFSAQNRTEPVRTPKLGAKVSSSSP